MDRNWTNSLKPLLLGFGIGSCILLIAMGLFAWNKPAARLPLSATQSKTAIFTEIPTETAVSIFTATSAVNPSVEELLMDAENRILNGNPEDAKELLLPNIEGWSSLQDKARGYKLLGDAEASKGHFKLAVPYYEKAFFYQPTADNLFTIAITEDMGGDLCNAFKHYQQLDSWVDPGGTFDKDLVKARIKSISCILGTKNP